MSGIRALMCLVPCVVFLAPGCFEEDSGKKLSGLGEACVTTDDCEADLVCAKLVCAAVEPPADASETRGDALAPPEEVEAAAGFWTDPTTRLTWENPPASGLMPWDDAKGYCDMLVTGGSSDWRMPAISELRSLVRGCPATQTGGSCSIADGACLEWACRDNSCDGCEAYGGPGANGCYWPPELEGTCYEYDWASTVEENSLDGAAWYVEFSGARVGALQYDSSVRVRCVH